MSSTPTVCIDGELTIYRAAELCEALKAAFSSLGSGDALEIDLSSVTEMDTAGVQLLLSARQSARAAGHVLRLLNPSAAVTDVFETLQLAPHFADASAASR